MHKKCTHNTRYKLLMTLLGFSVMLSAAMANLMPVKADNPTFFLSNSATCSGAITSLDVSLGSTLDLYVCIDAESEGAGLLGAETQISYDTSDLDVSGVECNLFDTCIDLSEFGMVKLLAASGPLPDGQPATSQEDFGNFSLDFNQTGSTFLGFSVAQVINENQEVENRSGIGITINVSEEEIEEEEPAEEGEEEVAEEGMMEEETEEMEEEEEEVAEEEEMMEEVVEEEPAVLSSVAVTPLAITATPGSKVQIISKAHYTEDRPSDNITSCFPCPTGDNTANGTTTYNIVSGPGSFIGSKVSVPVWATPGDVITINADYADNISGTSGLSANQYITVIAPAPETPEDEEEAEEETDKEPGTEKEETETEEATEESTTEDTESAETSEESSETSEEESTVTDEDAEFHESAADYEEEAEKALEVLAPQENSDLEIPTQPVEPLGDTCLAEYSQHLDQDQDGLSDRTECYLKTDPQNPDTDNDSCFDGEEVNRFYSNPLTSTDCNIQQIEENVVIVDPKPDWIVKSFDISGTTPSRSQRVGITAFPSVQKFLDPVITGFAELSLILEAEVDSEDSLAVQSKKEAALGIIATLEADLLNLNTFLAKYGNEYESLPNVMGEVLGYMAGGPADMMAQPEKAKALSEELKNHQFKTAFLGEVTELQEVGAGQSVTAGFHLLPDAMIEDGVYDLVATAIFENGNILSSSPVRMILDSTVEVPEPTPQSLDGVAIENIVDGLIQVENGRPVLMGQSLYGAQVFATWESLVLASSIIADSSEGGFDIQAPRELTKDETHTVSVYAVSQQAAGKVRSNTVTVDFAVGEARSNYVYWIIAILVLLALAAAVAKKRMIKIDHIAPEHRMKENELYEAFGLEKHHDHDVPANHEEKEEEIREAYGTMDVEVKTEPESTDPETDDQI